MSKIFISGLPKSGTSMVRALLDSHPEIYAFPANEFELFYYTHHQAIMLKKFSSESDPDKVKEQLIENPFITRLNDKALSYKDFCPHINVCRFQSEMRETDVQSYRELIEQVFRTMAKNSSDFQGDIEKVSWSAKCVYMDEFFPELLDWFDDLKFVYVLRNPYGHFNAVRSSHRASSGKGEGDSLDNRKDKYPVLGQVIRCMNFSYYNMAKWRELYPENFHVVVYDEVLMEPKHEMEKLSEFLGVKFSESMLKPTTAGTPWGGNSWSGANFKGIDSSPAMRWKEEMSSQEIKLVNHYFTDFISDNGFDVVESNSSLWRKMHASESFYSFIGNRILYRARNWFRQY